MTEPVSGATLPVLPRELTDLSPEVRAVPAPPTPTLADPYSLVGVDPDADAELIAEWMSRPHLAQAWESAWPTERWRGYLKAQLAGEYSRPYLGAYRGVAHGYIEIYRAAKDSIGPRYDADPHDLGVHAAIAELRFVNRGFAPLMLPKLTAALFALEPGCRRIMFDPDHRNTGARRLCEWAGCEFLGEHQMSNRKMALYALRRPDQSAGPTSSA